MEESMLTEVYNQFITQSLEDSISYFLKKGNKVGTGMYGICIIPPDKDYVYKVWTIDPAYDKWINYCLHASDKHFPFVYKIKTLPIAVPGSEQQEVTIAKIKRYKPVSKQFLSDLKWKLEDGNIITFSQSPLFRPNFRETNGSAILKILKTYISVNKLTIEFTNTIIKTIGILMGISSSIGIDLHEGNIMMDGRNFIISDPAVSFDTKTVTLAQTPDATSTSPRMKKLDGTYRVNYDDYFKNNSWSVDTPDSIFVQQLDKLENTFFESLPSSEVIMKFLKINFPKMINPNLMTLLSNYNLYDNKGYTKKMAKLFIDIMHSDIELPFLNKHMLPAFQAKMKTMMNQYSLYKEIANQL
jgi:hypothetical protein